MEFDTTAIYLLLVIHYIIMVFLPPPFFLFPYPSLPRFHHPSPPLPSRVEKLENEAKVSLEKFEEINKKWVVAKMKDIPQDLRDSLISQQQLCGLLVQDKNHLITELQQVQRRKEGGRERQWGGQRVTQHVCLSSCLCKYLHVYAWW